MRQGYKLGELVLRHAMVGVVDPSTVRQVGRHAVNGAAFGSQNAESDTNRDKVRR